MDCFSFDEILRLLQCAYDRDRRDWLLLCVTFLHALRAHEVVGLTADNVVGDYLIVQRGKRSKPERAQLEVSENPLLNERPAMFALCRSTPRKQRLFPITTRTFQRRVHLYGELAGLSEILSHPHTLKASILTHLDANGMSTRQIMDISGHKSLRSLEHYLKSNPAVSREKYRRALTASASE
ncbi:MAG: tyrosine-type recombinase/integrase [Terriglobales bacterium]